MCFTFVVVAVALATRSSKQRNRDPGDLLLLATAARLTA